MTTGPVSRQSAKVTIQRSSKVKGDEFEQTVADVFRCTPGTTVLSHVKVAGKDVDLLVTVRRPFSPDLRIVVDTKDYDRVITRDKAAAEFSSYYPLVANKHADQFMLVTRRGVVANAKQIFDGNTSVHYTLSELENLIVDPSQLVGNMEAQFSADGLSGYYVDTTCYNVDLKSAVKKYDLIYNEFISFCASENILELDAGRKAWLARKGNQKSSLLGDYTEELFRDALASRRRKYPSKNLEPIVWSWLSDGSHSLGIALLGTYGTGKSSFARKIAHRAALDFKSGRSSRIPLLIELREFGSHQSIEGLITHTLINKHSYSNGSFALFQKMNLAGRYFIILDGFDEMKQGMTKDALIYNFSQLNALCVGRSKVMLCGRPTMFESEEEQIAILTGSSATNLPSRVKYIPLEIAPLQKDSILEMMASYVKVREPKEEANVKSKLSYIRNQIQANSDLADLLSRPVHIPMFVTILPEFNGHISELSRGFLYETFIRKTITREVLRLPPAYQHRYTTEQRFQFVGSLAVEMAKRGETRSIRRSEIPPDIIRPFVNHGENIEIASRDLVAACFLEQKPPDILSFGHKSFLEFLTARYLLNQIRINTDTEAHALIYPTHEIGSFVLDLCEIEDLQKALDGPRDTQEFMVSCLLQATSELWIAGPYTRPKKTSSAPNPRKLGFGVMASERTRVILRSFSSSDSIATISRTDMSSLTRHAACYILYVCSLGLEGGPHNLESASEPTSVYSDQTWEDIQAVAAKSEQAEKFVRLWREQIKELNSHTAEQPENKTYHEQMDFLSRYYRQVFSYYTPLATISAREHSS